MHVEIFSPSPSHGLDIASKNFGRFNCQMQQKWSVVCHTKVRICLGLHRSSALEVRWSFFDERIHRFVMVRGHVGNGLVAR